MIFLQICVGILIFLTFTNCIHFHAQYNALLNKFLTLQDNYIELRYRIEDLESKLAEVNNEEDSNTI